MDGKTDLACVRNGASVNEVGGLETTQSCPQELNGVGHELCPEACDEVLRSVTDPRDLGEKEFWSIEVRSMAGDLITVARLETSSTVAHLQQLTQEQMNFSSLRLVHGASVLVEGQTLAAAGLADRATVRAVKLHSAVVATAYFHKEVRLWAFPMTEGQDSKEPFGERVLRGHRDAVCAATFSPDKMLLATASADGTARIWHTGRGECLQELRGHEGDVRCVAFSLDPIGELKIATGARDGVAILWNAKTGERLATMLGHGSCVLSIAFSPVGSTAPRCGGVFVATGSADTTAKLWALRPPGADKAACEKTLRGHGAPVFGTVFDATGLMLATGAALGGVKIWDVETGAALVDCAGHGGSINSVSFSPDGALLATASTDMQVKLFTVSNGQCTNTFGGFGSYVNMVEFSPDGSLLVALPCDGAAKVWEVATGKCTETFAIPNCGGALALTTPFPS